MKGGARPLGLAILNRGPLEGAIRGPTGDSQDIYAECIGIEPALTNRRGQP